MTKQGKIIQGQLYLSGMTNDDSPSNILYYNNGEISYGQKPTGGGSGPEGEDGSVQFKLGTSFSGSSLMYDESVGTFHWGEHLISVDSCGFMLSNLFEDYETNDTYYFFNLTTYWGSTVTQIGIKDDNTGFINTNIISGISGDQLIIEGSGIFAKCPLNFEGSGSEQYSDIYKYGGVLKTYSSSANRHLDLVSKKNITIVTFDSTEDIITGDGVIPVLIPLDMNNYRLNSVIIGTSTPSTSGTIDVQIRRVRSGSSVDLLSTKPTLGVGIYHSQNGVINSTYRIINTGDFIYVDVDAAGTNAKGLFATLTFAHY